MRSSKIFIALFTMLALLVAAAPSLAAVPAVQYGASGSAGAFPKPIHDWIHKYIIDPFRGEKGGFADPRAPFDTPIFNSTALVVNEDGSLAEKARPALFAGVSNQFVTTSREVHEFLESLPKNYLRWDYVMNITTYDTTSAVSYTPVRNFGYPLVVLSKGPNGPVFAPEDVKALGKPIYYVQPGNHANEWCGPEAALSIIKRLAFDEIRTSDGKSVLDKISVVMMPRYNVDGVYWNIRGTNSIRGIGGPDTNRDGSMFIAPNSRIASTILNAYLPHFGYDCHQMGWTTGVPSGTTRYYNSGVYGSGATTNAGAVTVANNTQTGTGTTTLNRHYLYGFWAPIDLPNKFHNTPQILSDWQDKSLKYMEKDLGGTERNMHLFPYTLWSANTYVRDYKGIETANGLRPGDRPALFRGADCIPDEGYGDGFLGLKQMIAWCTEAPAAGNGNNIGSDGFNTKMYFNFVAMECQMKFLAENAKEIYNDVENARKWLKTDDSKIALWNVQTMEAGKRQKLLKPDHTGQLADPKTGDHFYEYEVPFWLGNSERKAGKTVERPYAYIIDPGHNADNRSINSDLAVFRLAYSGIPVYRLTEEVTLEVEGSSVRTIQSISTGNANPTITGGTPAPTDWDENGNFTGNRSAFVVSHGDPNGTYLGGPDTTSSFGIQSQRISHVDTAVETKTFPAGSYVIPIQGDMTNWANLHASFLLEALGKRNLGNSYNTLRQSYNTAALLALQWPYQYWQNYFPVAAGSKFPAYRYMQDNLGSLKLDRVYASQPFSKGADYSAGYPVNLSILQEKGFNLGEIQKVTMAYHFMASGTFTNKNGEAPVNLSQLNAQATSFSVMLPTKYEGVEMKKWYVYDWDENGFVEAVIEKSPTSGANFAKISGAFIGDGYNVALVATTPIEALADAWVDKLTGNKNNLHIEVTEIYPNGADTITYKAVFSINNNAADTYQVGPYKVYVDTKGNVQIRACYIVK